MDKLQSMKKKILQLLFIFFLSIPLTFGQTEDKNSFWSKWGVGGGYNFLNNSDDPEDPFDKRTFELSVKYRLTDRHSFYLMVPLYVENSKKLRKNYNSDNAIPCLHRIWGTELGYNYTVFDWMNISAFGGIGLGYLHSSRDTKNLTEWDGNKWTDYFMIRRKYNGYGLSPQVGIAYRFQHVGCELKYKYSLYRMKSDMQWIESDGHVIEGYERYRFDHYFESLHGLSIGLFYYF